MSEHRNFGQKRNCEGCRFWSEMIAKSDGHGIEAMCLADAGPKKGKYTSGSQTCASWKSGHFGAVDEPPDFGAAVQRAYAAEEAEGAT